MWAALAIAVYAAEVGVPQINVLADREQGTLNGGAA
jgi:hypothetical protein